MPPIPPPSDLTTAYNDALAITASRSARDVLVAMRRTNGRDIASDWPVIARRITSTIVNGQESSNFLTSWYLEEAVRSRLQVPAGNKTFPNYAGTTRSGMSIARYVNRTPTIVAARIAEGVKPELAFDTSTRRLVSLAGTEPHRLARAAIAYVATEDRQYSGWERVAEPDACDFCEMLATRGDAYTSKASAEATSADLAYHNNCRCTAEPVLASEASAVNAAGARTWAQMDSPTIYATGARSAGRSRGVRGVGTMPATLADIASLDSAIRLEQGIIAEGSRIAGRTATAEKRLAGLQARREALLARHYSAPGARQQLEATLRAQDEARWTAQLGELESTLERAKARLAAGDTSVKPLIKHATSRAAELRTWLNQ